MRSQVYFLFFENYIELFTKKCNNSMYKVILEVINMGNKLKEVRKEKGLTLIELSEKTQIPRATLNRYENNTSEPKQETWEMLADFFNVSVPYIMGLSNSKISEKYALEVAKKVYLSLLNDEQPEKIIKILEYFNDEKLDDTLISVMDQYFSFPYVNENKYLLELKGQKFLKEFILDGLRERYLNQVKTNQNLITDVFDSLKLKSYHTFSYNLIDHVNVPMKDLYNELFKGIDESELFKDNTTIDLSNSDISATYRDKGINKTLQKEIQNILDKAQKEIINLADKYPDEPSNLEMDIWLSGSPNKGYLPIIWQNEGNNEIKDEIQLEEWVKEAILAHFSKKLN